MWWGRLKKKTCMLLRGCCWLPVRNVFPSTQHKRITDFVCHTKFFVASAKKNHEYRSYWCLILQLMNIEKLPNLALCQLRKNKMQCIFFFLIITYLETTSHVKSQATDLILFLRVVVNELNRVPILFRLLVVNIALTTYLLTSLSFPLKKVRLHIVISQVWIYLL